MAWRILVLYRSAAQLRLVKLGKGRRRHGVLHRQAAVGPIGFGPAGRNVA
jgi:hypothetical protein